MPLCISVNLDPSRRFSTVVARRLPTYRYSGIPPRIGSPVAANLDPNDMSAYPARIGAISSGTAFGSYW